MKVDVLIIGAGVSGSAIARELAKTKANVLVLEKESDVCSQTSKANSGIVHAGYDAKPDTLKAKLNVKGNAMMKTLSDELSFDYKQIGSLVLCFEEEGRKTIDTLFGQGKTNGVPGLEIWEREQILAHEPNVNPDVVCALYAPSAGIVCPFGLNIALAENAADNGVDFRFNEPVVSITKTENSWIVNGKYEARYIVNAAGVYADEVHQLVFEDAFAITPRKGQYFLLDHETKDLASMVLFQLPTKLGKGVLVTPTVHENILIGPTAEDIEDKEDTATSGEGLDQIRQKASCTIPNIPYDHVITSFSGSRAVSDRHDFIIERCGKGWIDVAGIESPGLTSAPAIGEMVAQMIIEDLSLEPDPDYSPFREGFTSCKKLSAEQWSALIEKDPAYGAIVCRCETITEGEIKEACLRSIPATSVDAIKRRVRPGMGKCQGGFCLPKVMEILQKMNHVSMDQIQKSNHGSEYITAKNKEGI